jgi:predicted transcriptional regulator
MSDKVTLTVELPEALIPLTGMSAKALPAEIAKLLAAELVRRGELTYTRAAELLEISQAEFMAYLCSRRVSILALTPDELREELSA